MEAPPASSPRARELDLTNASSSRIVWLARLLLRCSQIAFWLVIACAVLPFACAARRSARGGLGSSFAFLFRRLGATFIKIGQIAATRPDIFSHEATTPLTALQDRVPPFRFADVRRSIEEDFGRKLEEIFAKIEEQPVASASVAQVHRALLQEAELPPGLSSRIVAVKVRRPGIVRTAQLDRSILELGARLLSFLTSYSLISPREAVGQFCRAVEEQLDFRIEAENSRTFRKNFEADPHICFPTLVEHLCSDRVLTMEFVNGVKDGEILAVGSDPEFVARKGTEAIVRMIFQHGFVHADLHPGNVLFMPANRIAVFDLGLVGRLDENDRTRYAFFCYYVVSGMGVEVARWIAEQSGAQRVRDYAQFERDVVAHVTAFHDRPFEEVQLTGFLVELYDIVRRYGVRLEATFTIPNIALMVIEGIGRKIYPKLNVTRESRPYLESSIALAVAGPAAASGDPATLSQSTPTALAGGRYRVRRLLGEGVRKRVYLARDTRLDRDVAIAFIRTDGLDENGRAAVTAEARAVARLSDHPRIVPVHDSGEEKGVPYIVSQYMAGGTLSGKLLRTTDHRMPIDDALRFVEQICQALEHAHAHGIVHRDVKPENVWLTEDGFAKLGDFGLARRLGGPDAGFEGITVGTALYMSPEQALGRHLDARSDLYSLGASLYELLTGRPPFEGESVADVISRHISANPESPSRRNPLIPPALDALVLKLLAKSPDNRFETAAAVREALREVLAKGSAVAEASDGDDDAADEASARFVGREAEIGRLRKSLEEALSGRGRLALVAGEPGIGKTRLVTQFASYAETRSARVFFARCHEGEAAPAFWPWVQIIRAWLQGRDAARIEAELGGGASFVAQIVPEIRERIPDLPDPPAIDGEVARFRLFDAVATFLKRAAESQALVLVLDDLHWADKPSLLLLQFLARQMGGSRLLVLGTYRDVDVQHGHPLAEVLPSLRRERVFERVLLRGMSEDEVAALVTTLAGEQVPASFVRAVARETEGNPFFIEETLRHLVEEQIVARERGRWTSAMSVEEMGLPEGIRDVIGRRLARLSDRCREALTVASAIGREFEARLLPAVAGVELDTILVLLDEAVRARIVEQDRAHSGRYRFAHALVRETLYGEVRTGERVQLHRKIAEALETLHADHLEPHLPELAHHFLEAVPATDAGRAVRYATLGAEQAARQMAFEEAAALYRRSIRVLALAERAEDGHRCELLLRLGQVEWDAGEWTRSKTTIRQAIDLTARVGTHEQLARAALAYSGRAVENTSGQVDHEQIRVLERALAALPREDSSLRALTLGRLAAALAFSPRRAECEALATEALEMARRVGDQGILSSVLVASAWARWSPDGDDERVANLDEAIRLARELGDDGLAEMPRVLRYFALVHRGDVQLAEEALAELQRTRQTMSAYAGWIADGITAGAAMLHLPASEAGRLVEKAAQTGRDQNRISLYAFAAQRTLLLWQWGRIEEANKVSRELYGGLREFVHPYLGCASAFLDAELGDVAQARKTIDRFARNGFRDLPRDAFWCACVSLLASAVTTVGDVRSAEVLYGMLLPYASRIGVLFVHTSGAVPMYLGLLATTLSRLDDAAGHFEQAMAMHERVPAMLVLTQYHYGRLLLLRAAPGDRKRAISLLASAVEGARRLEMKRIADQALEAKLEAEGVEPGKLRSSIDLVTASIEARGSIDVRRATAPNGTVTLLFSDMEGFTEMTEQLGDAEAHRVMQAHHAIIRGELRAHGGSEIEVQGDGFLLAFPRATEALRYAITVQRLLAAYRAEHPDRPIRVRMGLHTGEPIREGKRFFGKTVILASRISAHARGNEVLVSSIVHGLAEPSGEFHFDSGDDLSLKGLSGVHRVYGLVWDPSVPARQPRVETEMVTAASALEADSVFRREGDYWTISYEGRSIRLRDAKGLQYVATLLRRAGEEIHAADLVANGTSHPAAAGVTELNVAAGLGDAGEVLDEKARSDYRQRLESLRDELEDAREMNDSGRAERIEQEIEFITQELSAAFGLGGRARKVGSSAERARKAVSSRVTDTLSRIRRENPDLAVHLQNAIHLGLFCSYEPEKPVRWSF